MREPLSGVAAILVLVVASATAQDSRPSVSDRADERVRATLLNGESLIGVAKRGIKCEALTGGRFSESSDRDAPKAGIRLWYYRDLDGYLFLEYKRVANVEVLGALSRSESQELADAIASAKRVRDDARKAAEEARRAAEEEARREAESRPSDDATPAKPPPGPEFTAEEKSLLERFPPSEGWTPETFGELKRRSIVLDVYPNKIEREFIDAFDDWKKAYTKHEEANAAKGEAPKKPAPPDDD